MTKPQPRIFEVLSTAQVTPHMLRISLGGEAMQDFPREQEGGYVKLLVPGAGTAEKPIIRTYTIRRCTADRIDIDFVMHQEGGPAMDWARHATPGDHIVVGGPGAAKPVPVDYDHYLLFGDMTALPCISVHLERLPKSAAGHVVIEVQSEADRQTLFCPDHMAIQWIINPFPGARPDLLEKAARALPWPEGRVYVWCAAEFEIMRRIRRYAREERELAPKDIYLCSYWKSGLKEDAHRIVRSEDERRYSK